MSGENFNYGTPSNQPENQGLAIASMVLGIVSIITFCVWYLSIPCGIVGVVLGAVYNNGHGANGMSKAGIICSVVGMALAVGLILLAALGLSILGY